MAEIAYVGLGSNQGDRCGYLESGVRQIELDPGVRLVATSTVYETPPIGYVPQPHFLNAVVSIETALAPAQLLRILRRVEDDHGRQRRIRWGPRTLDLDLLIHGEEIVETEELILPHPRLTARCFVLVPLCEIAPDLRHPVSGKALQEYESELVCSREVVAAGRLPQPTAG
jgi:2-amino-4-hydroxy-6-hydroxymethyldihydropteridine diphosphokinase